MKRHIIGLDPLNTEYIWQLLFRVDFFPGGRINAAAMSAIDIALWDIKGKALGQPVYMLLGGKMRERVFCYTGIGGQDARRHGPRGPGTGCRGLEVPADVGF